MDGTMKGIVKRFAEPGAELCTDIPIPSVGEDDVLVKVHVAAICGTDQHIYSWNNWAQARLRLPMVFGHEFSGEIVAAGKNVTAYRPGDRIAAETHIPCNQCLQCRTGNAHNCENMQIIGVHAPGGFSEYAAIPQACVWKLDDAISYTHAAMLEPMGVAVHGVMSGPVSLKSVLILGCGPIGVMAVGAAKVAGASRVIAVDIVDEKLEMARKLGADTCINTRQHPLVEAILSMTGGTGVDVIIDYTGNVALIEESFRCLKKGGRYTMVGLPSKKLTLDLTDAVIYKEATINGVTGRRMYQTWYQCEDILRKKAFSLEDVIGGVYRLEDFAQAFADISAGKPGKMLFMVSE